MNLTPWKHAAIAATLAALSGAAFGQYVWINEQGVKQFSDMPPPSSVPKSRILKSPAGAQNTAAPTSDQPSKTGGAAAAASLKDKAPMTIAERNAEFQKRRMEQAEKEKKAAEEEKLAAAKAKNCEQARAYQRTLASGARITSTDKNGERIFLDDTQRAQEVRENQNILQECK